MRQHISKLFGSRTAAASLTMVFAILATVCCVGRADEGAFDPPSLIQPRTEIRSGGVLEESYNYHRQQPARMAGVATGVEPAAGWYGYGFPVSTFRWGWFGAEHYYPRVLWHDGYYGECRRYSYRRGY